MADADDKEKKQDQQDSNAQDPGDEPQSKNVEPEKTGEEQEKSGERAEKTDRKASTGGILQWVITAAAVLLFAVAGFALGRLLKGSPPPEPETADQDESSQQIESDQLEDLIVDDASADSQNTWHFPLEPAVANLDVPGVTRYVRATLILEISPQVDQKKGEALLKQKTPLLKDWLTIYLASLSLEDIRGDRNLKRIQSHILDSFNEKLFPDAKPQIKKVLFQEFAIQ
ncbi:MAG: flagellar basal body-associated FliL family protein [Planctomycetota bacterium]|nr:MAG: flagellar basal body-associated FliL family protein [Planctomycetota bacterium]